MTLLFGVGSVVYALTPGIRRAAENVGIALRNGTSAEPSIEDRSPSPSPLLRRSSLVVPDAPFNTLVRDPNNPADGDWFWVGRGGVLYETSIGDRGYPEPITRVGGELVTAPGYDVASGPRLPSEFHTVANSSIPEAPSWFTQRRAYEGLDRLRRFFAANRPEGVRYVERLRQALTAMERLSEDDALREGPPDEAQATEMADQIVSFQHDFWEVSRVMAEATKSSFDVKPPEDGELYFLTVDEMRSLVFTLVVRAMDADEKLQNMKDVDPGAALERALDRLREGGDWPDQLGGESPHDPGVDQDPDYPQRR